MPRDATETRARLIRAGERRFARDGVAGARLRDVVRDAGQANDSAVRYHFGSREGLLLAIAERQVAAMEQRRTTPTEDLTVEELVSLVVVPTAHLLRKPEGRDFLRIMEQVAGWSGLETGRPASVLSGTVLEQQLLALQRALSGALGARRAQQRSAAFATFLTASLADRARRVEAGGRPGMSHERYVQDLVQMLTGALNAGATSPAGRGPR